MSEQVTVICPKHGEHEHAITSNIPGHEGAWCQLCWLESLGPSLPYKWNRIPPDGFLTMDEMIPVPEAGWVKVPKDNDHVV